ncbi:MAG: cytochrome c maturation protein CcmE [Actinomycetota bacterium]
MTATARFSLAAGVIVAAVGGLIAWSLTGSTAYYKTPSELLSEPNTPGQSVRVAGKVVPNSISQSGATTAFALADGAEALDITTQDLLPDTFAGDVEVVVEGAMTEQGNFSAASVLVKCPSKFEAELASGDAGH